MSDSVLILTDDDGEYYTITPELIRLCKVRAEEHRRALSDLPKMPGDCEAIKVLGFESVGGIERAADPRIRNEYVEPMLKIVNAPNAPNP